MKIQGIYKQPDELTLNDWLAVDRTRLANERTHLSYMRTVVSMIVAAISLYNILKAPEGIVCAAILIVSAIYFFIRGHRICSNLDKKLNALYDEDE